MLVGRKNGGPARRPPAGAVRVTGGKSLKGFDLPPAGWKPDRERQYGEWREDTTKVIRTAGPKNRTGPCEARRCSLAPDNFELRPPAQGRCSPLRRLTKSTPRRPLVGSCLMPRAERAVRWRPCVPGGFGRLRLNDGKPKFQLNSVLTYLCLQKRCSFQAYLAVALRYRNRFCQENRVTHRQDSDILSPG